MAANTHQVNRTLVGIIALSCLGAAATLWIVNPPFDSEGFWRGGFTRVGLVMAAFWLALPTRDRDAAWANISTQTLVAFGAALLAVVLRVPFKVIIPALAVLIVLGYILRPREKQRPRRRPERETSRM